MNRLSKEDKKTVHLMELINHEDDVQCLKTILKYKAKSESDLSEMVKLIKNASVRDENLSEHLAKVTKITEILKCDNLAIEIWFIGAKRVLAGYKIWEARDYRGGLLSDKTIEDIIKKEQEVIRECDRLFDIKGAELKRIMSNV